MIIEEAALAASPYLDVSANRTPEISEDSSASTWWLVSFPNVTSHLLGIAQAALSSIGTLKWAESAV